jgi:hypothetical protein
MREYAVKLLTALVNDIPGRQNEINKWLPTLVDHLKDPKQLNGPKYRPEDVSKCIRSCGDSSPESYDDAVEIFCIAWNDTQLSNILMEFELGLAADYARIYLLMNNRTRFESCLLKLNQHLDPTGYRQPDTKWLSLNHVLSFFEKRCWFPTEILLPMGILSPTDFYFYIRRGYVLKDYGAGVKHGEFTHRLQWHVIMSDITNGFTTPFSRAWKHSAYELYTSLGESKQQASKVWSFLFDQPGDGNSDSFRYPDYLHQWLLQHNQLIHLTGCLSRRETKRRKEFLSNVVEYIKQDSQKTMLEQVRSNISLFNDAQQNHKAFKEFDIFLSNLIRSEQAKLFGHNGPPSGQPDDPVEKATASVYGEISSKRREDYKQMKTTAVSHSAPPKSGRTAAYSPAKQMSGHYSLQAPGAVYVASENFYVMGLDEVAERRQTSRGSLQRQF